MNLITLSEVKAQKLRHNFKLQTSTSNFKPESSAFGTLRHHTFKKLFSSSRFEFENNLHYLCIYAKQSNI
jgi:hypothetical protein